jgi:hypothetical protein
MALSSLTNAKASYEAVARNAKYVCLSAACLMLYLRSAVTAYNVKKYQAAYFVASERPLREN